MHVAEMQSNIESLIFLETREFDARGGAHCAHALERVFPSGECARLPRSWQAADLVVLDRDYMTVPLGDIKHIHRQ